jgi:Sugar (and other) transporter
MGFLPLSVFISSFTAPREFFCSDIISHRTDHENSWGPTPWLLGAEIFPLRARAKGMALSTVSNWTSNFVIAFITPPLFKAISGGYYFVLLGFCIISGIVVFFLYPETAHVTLEQLSQVFGDAAPNLERAETLTPLHLGVERVGSTMVLGNTDAEKMLLIHKDMSDGTRTSSNTTVGEPTLDTSGHVNTDHDTKPV